MKWVRDRDLLIAQTLAFVQSVSGMKPVTEASPEAKIRIDLRPEANAEKTVHAVLSGQVVLGAPALAAERVLELPRMSVLPLPPADLRQEIQSRVALFRAHQQRFHKARDQHFVSTMAQVRASNKTRPELPSA